MIKVRKMVEGIGVEKTFPLYSPLISKIEVTKTPKIRRAKLFYMRNLAGKATRLRTSVGLAAKNEKYSSKRAELLEGMGYDAIEPAAAKEEDILTEEQLKAQEQAKAHAEAEAKKKAAEAEVKAEPKTEPEKK